MTRTTDRSNDHAPEPFEFVQRKYSLFERTYMALLDGLFAAARFALRLGGRPLKSGLIAGFGWMAYRFLTRRQQVALRNLDLVYGDTLSEIDKQELTLKAFRHYVRFALDFLFDDLYWPQAERRARITIQNIEALEIARKEGRGFVVLSGHLGNVELGMAMINASGYPTYAIYKGFKNAWFDRFIGRKRLRCGYRLVEVPPKEHEVVAGVRHRMPRRSIRPALEDIWRSNHGVAIALDQYGGTGGLKIPFLGVPDSPTTVGALGYAIENRIPLTLQTCVYENDDRLIWSIQGPIFIEDQPGGSAATLEHYARLVNDWFSAEIKKYPEQYAWSHRRFAHHHYGRPRTVPADSSTTA